LLLATGGGGGAVPGGRARDSRRWRRLRAYHELRAGTVSAAGGLPALGDRRHVGEGSGWRGAVSGGRRRRCQGFRTCCRFRCSTDYGVQTGRGLQGGAGPPFKAERARGSAQRRRSSTLRRPGFGFREPSSPAPKSIHPSGERAAGQAGRAAAAGMVTGDSLDRLDFELEDDPLFSTPRPTKRYYCSPRRRALPPPPLGSVPAPTSFAPAGFGGDMRAARSD
jgi:hypothetical protein